jgi:hypothetical protein
MAVAGGNENRWWRHQLDQTGSSRSPVMWRQLRYCAATRPRRPLAVPAARSGRRRCARGADLKQVLVDAAVCNDSKAIHRLSWTAPLSYQNLIRPARIKRPQAKARGLRPSGNK